MGDVTTATLVQVLLVAILIGTANAFTTGLSVQDDITEPIRDRIWRRFPRPGQEAPIMELDGSTYRESPGTFLGAVIACYRCFGVWGTAVWLAISWALLGFPGTGVRDGLVLAAAEFAAACQVQRAWNART